MPQAAEEFAFEPSRARNIMIVAIFCGVILYAMVMLSVGMAVPYPELLAKLDAQRASGGKRCHASDPTPLRFFFHVATPPFCGRFSYNTSIARSCLC